MKILVVGGGGREHAVIKALKKNNQIEKIYVTPGNGGIAADAECVNIGAKDIEKIVEFFNVTAADSRRLGCAFYHDLPPLSAKLFE